MNIYTLTGIEDVKPSVWLMYNKSIARSISKSSSYSGAWCVVKYGSKNRAASIIRLYDNEREHACTQSWNFLHECQQAKRALSHRQTIYRWNYECQNLKKINDNQLRETQLKVTKKLHERTVEHRL